MIWIGRLLSIPLGLLLLVVLLFTLILLQVNGTFLDPNYYTEELAEANIYEFALNDLLTVALDEAREIDVEGFTLDAASHVSLDENPLVTSGLTTEQIVASVNRAIPPDWVQGLVEQSFDQFGKYITGERDDFEFSFSAGEQAAILVDEIMSLLRQADAYNLVYDELVIPEIEEALVSRGGSLRQKLPLGVDVSDEALVAAVRRIAPADWVQKQVEGIIEEVKPYFLGRRDTFAVRLEIGDRVEIALDEIKSLLREVDAYDLLYLEVVEPRLVEFIGESVELLFGVEIRKD